MAVWGAFRAVAVAGNERLLKLVSGPSGVDELMTVDGTEEMIHWTWQVVGLLGQG